jgi:hypothetical protein
MATSDSILVRHGVYSHTIVFEVGVLELLCVSLEPFDLTASVALGSLRELCRSRVVGSASDARRHLPA